MNIVLAGTGSVASIKYWKLLRELQKLGKVKGVLTTNGLYFANMALINQENSIDIEIAKQAEIYSESSEWRWNGLGDRVLHIDLKDWGDVLVIAPITANTLTKIALGLCNNLLTSMCYAWSKNKPIVVAPAMNTDMWENDLTQEHLKMLCNRGVICVDPVESKLACGVFGKGAMAPITEIIESVKYFDQKTS